MLDIDTCDQRSAKTHSNMSHNERRKHVQRLMWRHKEGVDDISRFYACARKTVYNNAEHARQTILSQIDKETWTFSENKKPVCNLYAYKCPYCHKWHITHTLQPDGKNIQIISEHGLRGIGKP